MAILLGLKKYFQNQTQAQNFPQEGKTKLLWQLQASLLGNRAFVFCRSFCP